MAYATEHDLKWLQVQNALKDAFSTASKKESFKTMSKLQEADIILRSIIDTDSITAKREERL